MIATIHSFSLKNKASGVVVDPCNDQLRKKKNTKRYQ
jgi:hypothetical protein